MDISYIINHLGEDREDYLGSAVPPIYQTTMYTFPSTSAMREKISHESESYFYTRGNNPTTDILQKKLAALEQAEDCLVFASGSAAVSAAVMSQVKSGDHIVCIQKPYSWTKKLMLEYLSRFNVSVTMVDGTDIKNFENAIQKNTKVLYAESPNSWTYEIQDLSALADLAKKHQLISIIDNSFSSPLYQSPIALGFDMTVHSGTKYIAGHSDAVAGVLCGTHKMMQHIFNGEFMTLGGIVSPFNAWLLLRGLRTLPIRMKHVGESALKIAKFLEGHEKVEKVYYPFLESSPQYELAKKQIKQPTGQLTITIKANDIETVERFCDGLKRFLLAVSWGSHESLIFPACVLYNSENYHGSVFPWNMIRFYIGLEEADILIEDLRQALELI